MSRTLAQRDADLARAARYSISVWATHPQMTAAELAAALDIEPNVAWTVGDARVSPPNGRPLGGFRKESYVAGHRERPLEWDLEVALEPLIAKLSGRVDQIAQIRQSGGKVMFNVTIRYGAPGAVVTVGLMSKLAAIGVELGLDVLAKRGGN